MDYIGILESTIKDLLEYLILAIKKGKNFKQMHCVNSNCIWQPNLSPPSLIYWTRGFQEEHLKATILFTKLKSRKCFKSLFEALLVNKANSYKVGALDQLMQITMSKNCYFFFFLYFVLIINFVCLFFF